MTIARALSSGEELGRIEGRVDERSARRPHRHAERDLGVAHLLEHLEAKHDLTAQRASDHRRSEVEVADEHLAMETSRCHRAEEGTAESVLVDLASAAEDLRERGGRAIELDGGDEAAREMDAMNAAAGLRQLEGARRVLAMKRAQQIAERRRLETTR